jgi:hypothetical protein
VMKLLLSCAENGAYKVKGIRKTIKDNLLRGNFHGRTDYDNLVSTDPKPEIIRTFYSRLIIPYNDINALEKCA